MDTTINPDLQLVLVTSPTREVSERLARAALEQHLAACVSIVPGLFSFYWWEGTIQSDAEELLLLKTDPARVDELKTCIISQHPYQTPEFLVLSVDQAEERYLAWAKNALANPSLKNT